MKFYFPTGRRNRGRTLKRLVDTWDRNGSTGGPTGWQIYDGDDGDDEYDDYDDDDDDVLRYFIKPNFALKYTLKHSLIETN